MCRLPFTFLLCEESYVEKVRLRMVNVNSLKVEVLRLGSTTVHDGFISASGTRR